MLVLSRHAGEAILLRAAGLDQEIQVRVVRVRGSSVQLGFMAPHNVTILRAELGTRHGPLVSHLPTGERFMRTAQKGDRVQIHYVKRFQDGSVVSSHGRTPLDVTVGTDHPRLPGLGLALVGLAPGTSTQVNVSPEHAYGPPDPTRVHRWARTRFATDQPLHAGGWVRTQNRQGRHRLVRIVEVRGEMVVVDTNHRWAGQAMELEVELITIQGVNGGSAEQGL
jgi:carbon storage regulator CsrA